MKLNSRGEIFVSLLTIIFLLLVVASLVTEYMRIHTMQSKTEQQLIQAVHIALEASMHDSHRQDGTGIIYPQIARDAFYSYLFYNMDLDSSYRLYESGGGLIYRLENLNLNITEDPPAVSFSCTMKTQSIFSLFTGDIAVTFNIKSRNARIN